MALRSGREQRVQYAALAWRLDAAGEVQVLLITSRETQRWIIPKGWRIKDLSGSKSAAREAYEEAGVEGEVAKRKIGQFAYEKRLLSGRFQKLWVNVYELKVQREREDWPERSQRQKLWTSPAEAASLVGEPELQGIIAKFTPRNAPRRDH